MSQQIIASPAFNNFAARISVVAATKAVASHGLRGKVKASLACCWIRDGKQFISPRRSGDAEMREEHPVNLTIFQDHGVGRASLH